MTKRSIPWFQLWEETMDALARTGLLLCSVGVDEKPNTMTIGWMTGGIIWGKPILTVLVRPSRYTYGRLEQIGEFTVNVMPPEFGDALQYCGTISGRDADKFGRTGLKTVAVRSVRVPVIDQALIQYECRVVQKNDVAPDQLSAEIMASAYPKGDFHRVYYGEICAVHAAPDASERLRVASVSSGDSQRP